MSTATYRRETKPKRRLSLERIDAMLARVEAEVAYYRETAIAAVPALQGISGRLSEIRAKRAEIAHLQAESYRALGLEPEKYHTRADRGRALRKLIEGDER